MAYTRPEILNHSACFSLALHFWWAKNAFQNVEHWFPSLFEIDRRVRAVLTLAKGLRRYGCGWVGWSVGRLAGRLAGRWLVGCSLSLHGHSFNLALPYTARAGRQLIAAERQLMPADRQLIAADGQLIATSRQLIAADEQLIATYRQLIAAGSS